MAQSDQVQFHVGDPEWAVPRHGMRAQVKHRIELVRHGETECNIGLTTEGKTHTTPDPALTARGRQQAEDVGRFYNGLLSLTSDRIPTFHFEMSPLQRTYDTAVPTIKAFQGCFGSVSNDVALREYWRHEGVWVPDRDMDKQGDHHPTGARWWCPQESLVEFRRRVHAKVEEWMAQGSATVRRHTIVFGHSLFINTVLTHHMPDPASDDEELPVFFHLPNGSITVIDIDTDNKMHIHCVGYTQHLTETSGQHTAHVAFQQMLRPSIRAESAPALAPATETNNDEQT